MTNNHSTEEQHNDDREGPFEDEDELEVNDRHQDNSEILSNSSPPSGSGQSSSPGAAEFFSKTGSPTNAALASVQAALAALQAGQMSLNQVIIS